ncbi:Transcriptional regulator, PadR family [Halorubrum sp. DM2]|uniref:PadR family transcriptional regulator n=1 Tax=Halorubrum sp. DM2 TaxID=2527867 RepID=UPI0024B69C05|nr:helix-turn-helix transcriptional regulator [Halorubrum sp. DM2]VTT87998.1 Transcriptional regulator, PadR family [Halorubrum sp. DM2]
MRSVVDGDGRDTGEPSGLADLTAFQRDILRFLDREDHRKGTAIRSGLETYYGVDVNHGRLYPSLDQLVEKGFVAKSQRNRRTNDYALTDAARDALADYDAWADGDEEGDT